MYQIYADDTLIYDGTVEDYKIGKGSGTLETNKAGSFTFSVYPEHFYYDRFVKKKTVIIVKKSGKILFRGRVLDDKDDFWNRREIICEGELNFLQDSIIRPYNFQGTPEEAFVKYITEHNAQVDEFKRFKIGRVTALDPNNYIARSNSAYENTLKNITSRLQEDSLGGYLHITHGDDGKDPVPTLHYLADFTEISSQIIEFGSNLKDYLKKGTGQAIATAIIPLGAKNEDSDSSTEDPRLTIASVNDGVDYVYDEAAVAKHGWIFETVIFDDVTVPSNLKAKGEAELSERIRENITVELTAVDLHLLNRSVESFRYDTYVRVVSAPHKFAETLLCHKQTFNILKPENDTITLGSSCSTFTGTAARTAATASKVTEVQKDVTNLNIKTNAYKIAEQRLTSLMAQSFGVFKTEEVLQDGSTVYYMHDKPTLAESRNIWKMTGDAFAVSSDGGQSWSAGMDASGNAILNALSVIGIDASWIRADNLAAISAYLGGWTIKDNGLYTTFENPDDGSQCSISIRPPYTAGGATYRNFVEVFVSDEDGAGQRLRISDKEISMNYPDGNGGMWANLRGGILTLLNTNTQIKCEVANDGIRFFDTAPSTGNYEQVAYLRKEGDYWYLRADGGVYTGLVDATDVSADTLYAANSIGTPGTIAGKVRSTDGISVTLHLAFTDTTINLAFTNGILTDAYYS